MTIIEQLWTDSIKYLHWPLPSDYAYLLFSFVYRKYHFMFFLIFKVLLEQIYLTVIKGMHFFFVQILSQIQLLR
jgi:hypothetical protein